MKNIFKLSVLAALILSLNACSPTFIDKERPYSMTEEIIYADPGYIESALLGCYDVFKSSYPSFMGGLAYVVFDCRGDDIVNVSNPVTMQDTYEMHILPTSTENTRIWNLAYGTINTCNIFIDNIAKYNCASEDLLGKEVAAQYVAEAKFLRAYSYYVLVNLYSEPYVRNANAPAVPLRLTGLVSSGNNDCPLSTISEIYQQILDDCIPADLKDAPGTRNGITRASAAAARVLRMRVYMAEQKWDEAIAEGEAITGYEIDADVTNLYGKDLATAEKAGSKELIFSLPMSTQDAPNTQMSAAEYFSAKALVSWLDTESGILSQPNYSQAFDQRISSLTTDPDDAGRVFSLKFVDQGEKLDWVPLIRFAEAKLNLAECYANKSDGAAKAQGYLNDVRSKRIAPADDALDVTTLTGANLLNAVYSERRLEFICEGMRGIDIIRRGESFVKKNSSFEVTVAPGSNYYTWPIPDTEKAFNKAIK